MAWTVSRDRLTQYGTEMTENARIIYTTLLSNGWSHNAICALLGNIQLESSINPGVIQGFVQVGSPTDGYGLIQWTNTSATTIYENTLIAWVHDTYGDYDWEDGDRQVVFIDTDDASGWIPTSTYPLSYSEFKVSTESISYLTRAYFHNRERGTWSSYRITYANHWNEYFGGATTLSVTLSVSGNGTASVSNTTPVEGEEVTLTCIPASGETLEDIISYTIISGQSVAFAVQEVQTFTMPSESIIIYVTFSGTPPVPPPPITRSKMPLYMMIRRRTIL